MTRGFSSGRSAGPSRAGVAAVGAAVLLIVVAFGLYQLGGASGPGPTPSAFARRTPVVPTPVPTPVTTVGPTEEPGPTIDPASLAACTVRELALVAGGWGGATGSMAGAVTVVNVSADVCRVSGKPSLELRDRTGKVIATGGSASTGEPVALTPGAVATATSVWSNWCDDPPARPLSIRVALPGGKGTLAAPVVDWSVAGGIGGEESSSLPRCDTEGAPSTIRAPVAFAAPESREPSADAEACTADALVGLLGPWGAAAGSVHAPTVVFNQSGFDCNLDGSPPLELRDGNRKLVTVGDAWPDAAPVFLPAGWAAVTSIAYADWCIPPPSLPLRLDLVVGGDRVALEPTSERSTLWLPGCNSDPPSTSPDLGYDGPFALPTD